MSGISSSNKWMITITVMLGTMINAIDTSTIECGHAVHARESRRLCRGNNMGFPRFYPFQCNNNANCRPSERENRQKNFLLHFGSNIHCSISSLRNGAKSSSPCFSGCCRALEEEPSRPFHRPFSEKISSQKNRAWQWVYSGLE